jgi:hypothetical protein
MDRMTALLPPEKQTVRPSVIQSNKVICRSR